MSLRILVAAPLSCALFASYAHAQTEYPSRPVRWIQMEP
jgi:hypothetical protein